MEPLIKSFYLNSLFKPKDFQATTQKALEVAERLKKEYDFDTIVGSGLSGISMAFILSYAMKIPALCVRKEGDGSHYQSTTGRLLEGHISVKRYLIVDDFIASGRTVNYIINTIEKDIPGAECVAMLMYTNYQEQSHPHPLHTKFIRVFPSRPD